MQPTYWHYIEGNQTLGPFDWDQLQSLARDGIIKGETLVFPEAGGGWRTFEEACRESGAPVPIAAMPGDTVTSFDRPSMPITDAAGWSSLPVRPWRRFFARLLDELVVGAVILILLLVASTALISAGIVPKALASDVDRILYTDVGGTLAGLVILILTLPITALMIGVTGFSIGKALFGVKVVGQDLLPIGAGRAFRREVRVWFVGLGCGIPLVTIATMILSCMRLQRQGATAWDEPTHIVVLHRRDERRQFPLDIAGASPILGIIALAAFVPIPAPA